MSRKPGTKKGKADYARRKAIVEAVFGQIKIAQGGHQLRLRGQVKADIEGTFDLAWHNFGQLAGSGWTSTPMAMGNTAGWLLDRGLRTAPWLHAALAPLPAPVCRWHVEGASMACSSSSATSIFAVGFAVFDLA
jgi:Transposase DDE domain